MIKTSQYSQGSAHIISAGRQPKCGFHCARDHKSLWEMAARVRIPGREERDSSYTAVPGQWR